MGVLKYKVIKTRGQYDEYCNALEHLLEANEDNKEIDDEAELLSFLIEKWDAEHNSFSDLGPIELLKYLMDSNGLTPKNLTTILGISKGLVSEILSYKKGLSKEVIRKLAAHFKLNQSAFNKPYKLISPLNAHLRNASVMNTTKELEPLKKAG
jgi:HTH-type transcriptional regulator/antitoxin HigA